MANQSDRAYGLTLLSPILGGALPDGTTHDLAIRRELIEMNALAESPLADVPTTHLARWVVIDSLPYEGIPTKVDQLKYKYLLFTSNFDGELDAYLELLRTKISRTLDRLYTHCIAYPGSADRAAFASYMKRCQVETSFFFGAYTKYTLDDVLRALDAQRRVGDFIARQQDANASPAALQSAFRNLVAQLANSPTPRPGTL